MKKIIVIAAIFASACKSPTEPACKRWVDTTMAREYAINKLTGDTLAIIGPYPVEVKHWTWACPEEAEMRMRNFRAKFHPPEAH